MSNIPVKYTRYTSATQVTKSFSLNGGTGAIEKRAAAQMFDGVAETVLQDFSQFGKTLKSADEKTAMGFGLWNGEGPLTKIVTRAKLPDTPNAAARTKDHFVYERGPGVLMLDHDPHPRGGSFTPDGLFAVMDGTCPSFTNAARWVRGSVSAGVHKAGEQPGKGKGFHCYLPVADASDIPRFGAVLFKRLWLGGHGFVAIGASGALLTRSLVDGSVFSPERLDFVGRPSIESDGLEYTPPKAVWQGGGYLDTHLLPDLTEAEEAEYQRLVDEAKLAARDDADKVRAAWVERRSAEIAATQGIGLVEARKQVEAIGTGKTADLPPGFVLHFAAEGPVTVAEVLANPMKYDGKALADPIEGTGYGTTTATFFAGRSACIHSHAHGMGMNYFPKPQADTIGRSPAPGGNANNNAIAAKAGTNNAAPAKTAQVVAKPPPQAVKTPMAGAGGKQAQPTKPATANGNAKPQGKKVGGQQHNDLSKPATAHGVLLEHGEDNYKHSAENKMSYYVTVRDRSGREHTVWGIGLKEAMAETKAKIGDVVDIIHHGSQWVTVQIPIRDKQGKITGHKEESKERNIW